jgi:predicted neutral ceramidase superfamily lipid hydrolase
MSVVMTFFMLLLLALGYLLNPFIFVLLTFPLIANLATAFVYSRSREKAAVSPYIFLPLVWSLLIVCVGAIFTHHGDPEAAPSWPVAVVYVLLLIQLAHCIWLTIKNADNRWVTMGVGLLTLLFGWACLLVSLTSLTNQWE